MYLIFSLIVVYFFIKCNLSFVFQNKAQVTSSASKLNKRKVNLSFQLFTKLISR